MQSSNRSILMRGSIRLAAVAGALAMLTAVPGFAAQPVVKTVRWVASDPSVPHDTFAYRTITLKGTASLAGANVRATWDFGDGTEPATFAVENAYDVSARHVYFGAPGTVFTAKLTVVDTETGESGSADYLVAMRERNLDVEVNVAIDEGLWYLHTALHADGNRTAAADAQASAANVTAFERNGHKDSGDSADPYTETLVRALSTLGGTAEGRQALNAAQSR